MSNGRIEIEVQGVKHSLHFGMSAIRIFTTKSANEVERLLKENPKAKTSIDNNKAFAYIVYGGLCNYSDLHDIARPSFSFAYELTEEILYLDERIQNDIYACFSESRAGKDLLDKLPKIEKKSDPEKQ